MKATISRATTWKLYSVFGVNPVAVNDGDVLVPSWLNAPLFPCRNRTRYPVTPTLSVEAVHDRFRPVEVMADAARLVGCDGGVVSAVPPQASLYFTEQT